MIQHYGTLMAAGCALIAGFFWVLSARARVDAPPETEGVGALFGGYLVSKDTKGRCDLHETLQKQAKWNQWAAWSAAIGAGIAFGLLMMPKEM